MCFLNFNSKFYVDIDDDDVVIDIDLSEDSTDQYLERCAKKLEDNFRSNQINKPKYETWETVTNSKSKTKEASKHQGLPSQYLQPCPLSYKMLYKR